MERSYESAAALAARAAGPLAEHLGQFVASLIDQQYTPSVVCIKAQHALAFDRWLAKRCATLADIGEVHIERYQRRNRRQHRSICAETRRRERGDVMRTAAILARSRCVQDGPISISYLRIWLSSYRQHLQHQQGLAAATIERYQTFAPQFLHQRFGRGEVDLRSLRPTTRSSSCNAKPMAATTGAQMCRKRTALVPSLRTISW